MARLVEASRWVFFDIVAGDAAGGAHVAMELRLALPGATIRSAPDPSPSADALRPHLLHCRAAFAGATDAQARELLAAALGEIRALVADGGEPRARVIFGEGSPGHVARAA